MRLNMFRRFAVLVFVAAVAVSFLPATGRMGFSADLASAQDLILGRVMGRGGFQVSMDLRTMVSEEFQIRIPLSLSMNKASFMGEIGVMLVYFPWETGPFMGLSMLQIGLTRNCPDLQNVVNLNEVIFGWSLEFGPGLFVEPAISIRDPSGTFTDEYSRLKGTFPCYTTFRARLGFGWYFWR